MLIPNPFHLINTASVPFRNCQQNAVFQRDTKIKSFLTRKERELFILVFLVMFLRALNPLKEKKFLRMSKSTKRDYSVVSSVHVFSYRSYFSINAIRSKRYLKV